MKSSIVKNRARAAQFDVLGIPPTPVVTRWGSWINAALYYAKNLPEVKEIVNSWSGDGVLVRQVQISINKEVVIGQLTEISSNYADLPKQLKKLKAQNQ